MTHLLRAVCVAAGLSPTAVAGCLLATVAFVVVACCLRRLDRDSRRDTAIDRDYAAACREENPR